MRFILLSIFLIPCAVFCQGQEKISNTYIGFQISPNYSYRLLQNTTDQQVIDDRIDNLNENQKPSFGYRVAFTGGTRISKRWSFEGGMAFERYSGIEKNASNYIDPRWGWIAGEYDNLETITRTDYLGIPFRFVWNSGGEKTKFIASAGFTPQLLLSRKKRNSYFKDGEVIEETEWNTLEDMNDFNVSPLIGIGVEHSLSGRFFIRSEAIARFGVLTLERRAALASYIYSVEMNIGLYMNLFEKEKSYWSY